LLCIFSGIAPLVPQVMTVPFVAAAPPAELAAHQPKPAAMQQ